MALHKALGAGKLPDVPDTAPQRTPAEIAREIASDLPSPFCPGRSIASCSSGAARAVEQDIRDMAEEGKSAEEIESILMDRFGEEKIGAPMRSDVMVGVTLLALAAVAWIWIRARRWVRPEPKAPAEVAKTTLTEQERDRLEAELDRLDA